MDCEDFSAYSFKLFSNHLSLNCLFKEIREHVTYPGYNRYVKRSSYSSFTLLLKYHNEIAMKYENTVKEELGEIYTMVEIAKESYTMVETAKEALEVMQR